MTVHQRRRGKLATVYITHETVNRRQTTVRRPDFDNPIQAKVWLIPERSARAELPGQQEIDVIRIGVPPHVKDIDLWSRVYIDSVAYDVTSPPAYHHGTRHVRHYSVTLRKRTAAGGDPLG